MFLTRMALDVNRPEAVALINNGESMRFAILSAFAGGNLQPLFRVDQFSSRMFLVILSRLRPTMNGMHAHYGYPGVFPSWETFDYDDILEHTLDITHWHFELSASPAGLCDNAEDWMDPARLNEWLARQGESCGFRLREAVVVRSFIHIQDRRPLPLARWQGILDVTDSETFQWAVSRGIGPGAPWGAGLMTIAQADTIWD